MFIAQLVEVLTTKPFNLEAGLKLSRKIHEAEAVDYDLTKRENRLWLNLTDKIQKAI